MANSSKPWAQVERLLHALQLYPRINWTDLGKILGVNGTTVKRQWERLLADGTTWLSFHPSGAEGWFFFPPSGYTAYIRVDCSASTRDDVAAALVSDACTWSVEYTSGPYGLFLRTTLPSTQDFNDYVGQRLGRLPGVRSVEVQFVQEFLLTADQWRLGGLPEDLQHRILELRERKSSGAPLTLPLSRVEHAVLEVLSNDGRAQIVDIAERIGCSPSAVHGAITRITNSPLVTSRVNFVPLLMGWHICSSFLIAAPQSIIPEIREVLGRFPKEIREAVTLVGPANLYIHIWAQDFQTVNALEDLLCTTFPSITVTDRWLTTHFAKRLGRIIDHDGRQQGFVSMLSARPSITAPAGTTPDESAV